MSSEVSPRFNPRPGVSYGHCTDCDAVFDTQDQATTHLNETIEARTSGNSSHSIRITNPSRSARIHREISQIVEESINAAINQISDLVHPLQGRLPDATEEEATEWIRLYDEFSDAWDEYLQEY